MNAKGARLLFQRGVSFPLGSESRGEEQKWNSSRDKDHGNWIYRGWWPSYFFPLLLPPFFHWPVYLGSLGTLELFVNGARSGVIYKSRWDPAESPLGCYSRERLGQLPVLRQSEKLPSTSVRPEQLRHSHSPRLKEKRQGWQLLRPGRSPSSRFLRILTPPSPPPLPSSFALDFVKSR